MDLLCDKFAKYEMRKATKSRKGEGSSDGNVALSGQQSADKKTDLMGVTCYGYGYGEDGHLRRSCPTKWDEKLTT